jgi:hypothetical protein
MQINEYKTGWLRKKYILACTIMATELAELEQQLQAAMDEIEHALDYHKQPCKKVLLVIAAGMKSSRANRPAMRERLESDPRLRAIARRVKVYASFLNRMGDNEGKFRIRKG